MSGLVDGAFSRVGQAPEQVGEPVIAGMLVGTLVVGHQLLLGQDGLTGRKPRALLDIESLLQQHDSGDLVHNAT